MNPHHIPASNDAVGVGLTSSAGATTVVLWGLHVSDICMLMSTFATLVGLFLQIYLAMRRIHRLEHRQDKVAHVAVSVAHKLREHETKCSDHDREMTDGG